MQISFLLLSLTGRDTLKWTRLSPSPVLILDIQVLATADALMSFIDLKTFHSTSVHYEFTLRTGSILGAPKIHGRRHSMISLLPREMKAGPQLTTSSLTWKCMYKRGGTSCETLSLLQRFPLTTPQMKYGTFFFKGMRW